MKHLFSSLGLALLLLAWGGNAAKVDAQATYTEVKSVDFNSAGERTIPSGWTVVNSEEYAAATSTTAEVTGIRLSESYTWSGPNIRVFSSGIPFQKALYLRSKWPSGATAAYDGYAFYGDLTGTEISLEAGSYELRVPAFLWTGGGSTTVRVEVLENDGTELSTLSPAATLAAAVAKLTQIASVDKKLSYNVNGSTSDDLDGVEKVVVRFDLEKTQKVIIKVSAITNGDNENWTEIMFGGFSLYSYTGTIVESKYDDESMVFEETFVSATDNYSPAAGSGWTIYKDGAARAKGTSFNYNGSRIFGGLSGSKLLPAAYYCEGSKTYAIYGEGGDGEPTLTLEKGEYFVSYYAVAWKSSQKAIFSILNSDNTAIATETTKLTDNCSTDGGTTTSRTKAITPNHIQFVVTIPADGDYKLKLTSDGEYAEVLMGNITIRKNTKLTAISEKFTGLNNAAPAEGSGWTMYKDDDNNTVMTNGATGLSYQARIMSVADGGDITAAAYLRYNGYLTYGEKEELPLTLVGGKEYRISYYAALQKATDGNGYIACQIVGKDDVKELGTALSRTDYLSGTITDGAVTITPDYIETTFIPKKSGDYVLKFLGRQVHVANITLAENYEDPIAYSLKLDDNFGYATLYVDRAVAIPEGVEVYAGVINDGKVKLNAIEDNVPANTAVIVKGTKGATATFKLATAPAAAVEENDLVGVTVGTKLPTDAVYTLAYSDAADETTIGFYKSAAAALRANKAYLSLPAETAAEVSAVRFDFGQTDEVGNVTGIEGVAQEAATVRAIFDLQGRRVLDMSKPGLYVVGGRKVLVK